MLLYLPERIYNSTFANDEIYAEMSDRITKEIFVEDFVNSMINYEDNNPLLEELKNYIIEKTPEEYQLELKLCFDNDLEKYEDQFNEMDIESKLYWLCEVNGGDMKPTNEFIERTNKFIKIYNQNVLPNPSEYSNFIHMMYYMKMIYKKILEECNNKCFSYEDIKKYIIYEEKLFNDCFSKSDDERYINMLYSKREQMYVFYFEFVGNKCDNLEQSIRIIYNHLYQERFKYNNFTYFKLLFNLKCFQKYIDKGDIENSKKYWAKLSNNINYAFRNKKMAIKSLNHYNNCFLDEFLNLSKFLYIIEKTYIPRKTITINHLMTQKEKRYYKNKLFNDEKPIIEKYILKDISYSYEWANGKKVMLGMLE